jgi:hypothetical protein
MGELASGNWRGGDRRPDSQTQLARWLRRAALVILAIVAGVLFLGPLLPELLGDRFEEGVAVSNQTDEPLYVRVVTTRVPDATGRALFVRAVAPGEIRVSFEQGCGMTFEAYDEGERLVAQHPPVAAADGAGCDFTWVITNEGNSIERGGPVDTPVHRPDQLLDEPPRRRPAGQPACSSQRRMVRTGTPVPCRGRW